MKKKILLLITILLLTACNVEYNLEYKDGKFKEKIVFKDVNEKNLSDFEINSANFEQEKIYIDEKQEKFYDIKLTGEFQPYKITLKHEYSTEDFSKINAITTCYKDFALIDEKDTIFIEARSFNSDHWLCSYKKNMNFSFKSDYKILKSNADKVVKGSHVWNLKNGELKQGKVFVLISKNLKASDSISRFPTYEIIIALVGIVMIVAFIGVQIFLRKRVEN